MSERRRSLLILLLVFGLVAASAVVIVTKKTKLGLDLQGGVQLVYEGQPTPQQPKVDQQALDRALQIMRQRVDAFGVAEPELQLLGARQIEVNLPGVADADRAAQQVGSTAQLYFYDWEANILDPDCRTNPDQVTGGQQAITGLYNAVKQAGKCTNVKATDASVSAATPRFYAFDKVSKQPFENAQGLDSKQAALDALDESDRAKAEILEVPAGVLVVRDSKADPVQTASSPRPRPLVGHPGPPGARRHGHQEPGAELRPAGRRRPDRHLRLHRQGPQGVPDDHREDRPARRRQLAAGRRPAAGLPALRDRARRRAGLGAVHQLQREPGRHRRLDRRPDLRRLHDPDGAGPGEDPPDRRAADQARADLALAGVGLARRPGAGPGPDRGHRRLRHRRALPDRLLPDPRRDRDASRWASTRSTSTRWSS